MVEAAWLSVLAAALTTIFARREPEGGLLLEALGLCAAGLLIAWSPFPIAIRRGLLFMAVIAALPAALFIAAGAVEIKAGGWWQMLGAHPAAILAPLMVMRGAGVMENRINDSETEGFLIWSSAVVTIAWLSPWAISPELREAFQLQALVPTVLFATCGVAALAVARFDALATERGGQAKGVWWPAFLTAIAAGSGVGSLGALALLGVPVGEAVVAIWRPIATLLVYVVWPIAVVAGWLSEYLRSFASDGTLEPSNITLPRPGAGFGESVVGSPLVLVNVAVLVALLIALVALFLLVRHWLAAREELTESSEVEQTEFIHPAKLVVPPRRSRLSRDIAGAAGAYVAALRELATHHPAWARRPSETPRQHAQRLRTTPLSQVRWLAADYQLAQYRGTELSTFEQRRAVIRLAAVRSLLRSLSLR